MWQCLLCAHTFTQPKRISQHCSLDSHKIDGRKVASKERLSLRIGKSPTDPFFADNGALKCNMPSSSQHRKNVRPFNDEYGLFFDNTERAVMARAALLHFMLRRRMIPYPWWVLGAEAARCYEQAPGGKFIAKPTKPLGLEQQNLLRKLFLMGVGEKEFLKQLDEVAEETGAAAEKKRRRCMAPA